MITRADIENPLDSARVLKALCANHPKLRFSNPPGSPARGFRVRSMVPVEGLQSMFAGRFYLYRIFYGDMTLYIGKGTGKRLADQRRSFGVSGEIIAYYDCEREAYREERRLIAEQQPPLNRIPGGTGGWSSIDDLVEAPNGLTREGLSHAAPQLARLLIMWKRDRSLTGILRILGAYIDAHGLADIEKAVVPHIRRLLFKDIATENNAI